MFELILAVTIWGLSFALSKMALTGFHPLELVTLRLTLAAATAFSIGKFVEGTGVPSSSRFVVTKTYWRVPLVLGIFEFAGTYILYTWSLVYLPSSVVGALTLFTPVFTFFIAALAGLQKFSPRIASAVILSIGGALLCLPTIESFETIPWTKATISGGALIMTSNIFFAIGNVAITKFHKQKIWSTHMTAPALFVGAVVAALVMVVVAAVGGGGAGANSIKLEHFTDPSRWWLPVYLGIVATGFGFFLWNRGVQKVSAVPSSIVGNVKAPLSILFGAVILHERISPLLLVGVAILAISLALLPRRNSRDFDSL